MAAFFVGGAAALFASGLDRLMAYAAAPDGGLRLGTSFVAFGAAACVPTLWPRLGRRLRWLGQLALFGQVAVLGALVMSRLPPANAQGPHSPSAGAGWWLLNVTAAVLPMGIAGLVAGMALARRPDRVTTLAGAVLAGLALGYLSTDSLTWSVGTPTAIAASAWLFAATGTSLGVRGARARYAALSLAVGFSVTGVSAILDFPPAADGSLAVTLAQPDARALYARWTPQGRVDAVRFDPPRTEGGYRSLGVGTGFDGRAPRYHGIALDGRLTAPAYDWSRPGRAGTLLRHHLLAVPYLLLTQPVALTFSRAGGVDARLALEFGARAVTNLHPNPALAHVAWDLLPDFRRRGEAAGVHRRIGAPRSYLQATEDRYDLIALNLTRPLARRADAVEPEWLARQLTVEAIDTYFGRLTPTGLLTIALEDPMTGEGHPPVRATRLGATLRETLRRQGIGRPGAHVAVVGAGGPRALSVTLLKKWPFLPGEVARLEAFAEAEGFAVWHARERAPTHPVGIVLQEPELQALRFLQSAGTRLGAVTDDRPFSLALETPLSGWLAALAGDGPAGTPVMLALVGLMLLFAVAVGFLVRGQGPPEALSLSSRRATHALFGGAGLGAAAACMQGRLAGLFVVPPDSHRTIIVAMVLAVALGGLSSRLALLSGGALPRRLVALLAAVALGMLVLPTLGDQAAGQGSAVRLALAALAAAFPALFAGRLLAAGLALAAAESGRLVPWFFGLYGAGLAMGAVMGQWLAATVGYLHAGMIGLTSLVVATLVAVTPARVRDPSAHRSLETPRPAPASPQ